MEYENALLMISPEEMQNLIKEAGAAGAKMAMQTLEKEKKTMHKKVVDKRLHNTKLLLKNYHMLKLNMDNSVYGRSQMEESAADILSSMMNLYDDGIVIESIRHSATRTAIIISHVDTMLELYEAYCKKTRKEVDRRRFSIVHDFYISNKLLSVLEIADKYCQSKQTVYDDLKIAEERLTALIFGVDGLKLK